MLISCKWYVDVFLFVQANAQQKHDENQGTWAQAQQSLKSEIEMLKKDAESSLVAKVRHLYLHLGHCCHGILINDKNELEADRTAKVESLYLCNGWCMIRISMHGFGYRQPLNQAKPNWNKKIGSYKKIFLLLKHPWRKCLHSTQIKLMNWM